MVVFVFFLQCRCFLFLFLFYVVKYIDLFYYDFWVCISLRSLAHFEIKTILTLSTNSL